MVIPGMMYFMRTSMSTNFWQISFCFIGGILCFIPLRLNSLTDYADSMRRETLTSSRSRDSAIAASSLTLPIFLEIITDIVTTVSAKSEKVEMHVKQALLNTRERFVLACAILSISLTAFLPTDTPHLVNIYLCMNNCRLTFVGGAVIISLCRCDPNFWSPRKTYVALILLASSTVTGAFADNWSVLSKSNTSKNVAFMLFMLALAILLYCNVLWLYSMVPQLITGIHHYSRKMKCEDIGGLRNFPIFPFLYVLTVTLATIVLVVTRRTYPENERKNADALFYHNLGFNMYLLFIMYISERQTKFEVIQGLYALIESKKMYVRYISHELRTPLNSAFLGLKLVCDDLEASTDDKDLEHCETLLDVQSACRIAVEILNDLLCFDKLESGILEVHKHEVPVIPFIADCVNMFASQAREAGVTIKNITSQMQPFPEMDMSMRMSDLPSLPPLMPPPAVTDILSGDVVFMDKFKMDQALRNLISNALKFTSRGESVTVCASFIPGGSEGDDDATQSRRSNIAGGVKGSLSAPFTPISAWFLPLSVVGSWFMALCKYLPIKSNLRRSSQVYVHSDVSDIESCSNEHDKHKRNNFSGQSSSNGSQCGDDCAMMGMFGKAEYVHSGSHRGVRNEMHNKIPDVARKKNGPRFSSSDSHSNRGDDSTAKSLSHSGKLRIVVTDTGAGISEANLQRLFKEIVQFNPEVLQAGGGSGLGLWITSSIVQMHGGTIHAYSAGLNKGSTFTVEIDMQRRVPTTPMAQGSRILKSDSDESAGAREAMGYSKTLDFLEGGSNDLSTVWNTDTPSFPAVVESKSFKIAASDADCGTCQDVYDILVVDDSSLNRKLLCKLLSASGHTCEVAADGLGAVEKVKARMACGVGGTPSYDAILMDFVMPNMDGPTATETIRGLGYSGPIFGVTGNALGTDVNYFISHGADAVLAKPFDFKLFKQLMWQTKESK